MLQIGDRVVYPMHGAGEITGIEEYDVMGQGQMKSYYVMEMPIGGMRIMLPADNIDKVGLREVSPTDMVDKIEEVLKGDPVKAVGSWNKRFHANLNRLKTGDILEVAAVLRNLALQDRIKKISSGERRLLDTAKQIFLTEMVYVLDGTMETSEAWLQKMLERDN
ncbi:MAG TPA: CarD family transcriptional regulator [Anaerovibrio sp.]|uniref:CarD family transcriptional regulator n=1 Tax=Anaerovibrio lipolyticus TaxID=82374 RepID=UPI000E835C99|nr:CarD family transcriptional regulator [Anaerovibrio lipolyticus]MBE6105554.1 CarD family transcriptional regulator [Anaerovibrio lipolyticus]HAF31410.1 CarD family transcriptional regulator [Anaerovibrio sp.]HAQ55643.1 CarD family transcriptional regulator [Anaerovibrio sp.]HCP95259.1 CarD family transcriptional regulator [Anaerovibrio sp.]